jgi:hypothetical protein
MFMKFDNKKSNLAILFDTAKALNKVADVMSYGAIKYDRKNWDKCDDKERYISASLRHISEYLQGNTIDDESNIEHLAHSICSLLFVLEMDLERE